VLISNFAVDECLSNDILEHSLLMIRNRTANSWGVTTLQHSSTIRVEKSPQMIQTKKKGEDKFANFVKIVKQVQPVVALPVEVFGVKQQTVLQCDSRLRARL